MSHPPIYERRLRRYAERIHKLGPRPLYEMLLELGKASGQPETIAVIAGDFAAIDRDVLIALGGDQFHPAPIWRVV
jgi:hypothetical protein